MLCTIQTTNVIMHANMQRTCIAMYARFKEETSDLKTGSCLSSTYVFWGVSFDLQTKTFHIIAVSCSCNISHISPEGTFRGFNENIKCLVGREELAGKNKAEAALSDILVGCETDEKSCSKHKAALSLSLFFFFQLIVNLNADWCGFKHLLQH